MKQPQLIKQKHRYIPFVNIGSLPFEHKIMTINSINRITIENSAVPLELGKGIALAIKMPSKKCNVINTNGCDARQ
jgi:hypothetical protein